MTEQNGPEGFGPGGIVIAVLTYRRAEDLKLALPRLAAQAQSLDTAEGGDPLPAMVLVIDNDPAASARTTVEEFARTLPSGLIAYVHEPKPGIAAARNRALTESSSKDLLVFIDDDEIPSERWLAQLLDLQRTSGAAAIVGPVITLWCDEAVVVDRVPAERLTRDWVLRRALRSGNSAARVSLEMERKAGPRLILRVGRGPGRGRNGSIGCRIPVPLAGSSGTGIEDSGQGAGHGVGGVRLRI